MANLCVATDEANRRVVIRALRPEYARNRHIAKGFVFGAKTVARLNHPSFVRIHEVGRHKRQPFIVMDYVDAKNMREMILHRDPLLREKPLRIIRQLASALKFLHHNNLLHLDFKPENILVCPDARVVLIDFDLLTEKKKDRPVHLKHMPGTTSYIAPEVRRTRVVDERADIYSLGVTSYEILTYHKPYEAHDIRDVRNAELDPAVPPTPIGQYNPDITPRLEQVITKCLAKKVEERYPSAALMIRDLDSLI